MRNRLDEEITNGISITNRRNRLSPRAGPQEITTHGFSLWDSMKSARLSSMVMCVQYLIL